MGTDCCKPTVQQAETCCCGTTQGKVKPCALQSVDKRCDLLCRLSNRFRMQYSIAPGLYAVGNPTSESPVLVTANYRLTCNSLQKALLNVNAWVCVLDTKGINVWCAAGKGTFGTAELVSRIKQVDLADFVAHRTVIVPQLGAPGVAAHEVKKATGFCVEYGPVYASDIPAYLAAGNTATPAMRTVRFSFYDRLVLVPMELFPALKKFVWIILGCIIFMGIQPQGILYKEAIMHSLPIIAAGFIAILAGTVVTPLLLPIIPFASFAVKGMITGGILLVPVILFSKQYFGNSIILSSSVYMFFTAMSSYLALNFTGCTTFTNMTGVKKEMRIAVPVYLAACGISAALLGMFKLKELGVL